MQPRDGIGVAPTSEQRRLRAQPEAHLAGGEDADRGVRDGEQFIDQLGHLVDEDLAVVEHDECIEPGDRAHGLLGAVVVDDEVEASGDGREHGRARRK